MCALWVWVWVWGVVGGWTGKGMHAAYGKCKAMGGMHEERARASETTTACSQPQDRHGLCSLVERRCLWVGGWVGLRG